MWVILGNAFTIHSTPSNFSLTPQRGLVFKLIRGRY